MPRRRNVFIPGPEEGDYMVEWGEDMAVCFSGPKAHSEAYNFAKTLVVPFEIHRYRGWELVAAEMGPLKAVAGAPCEKT